MMGKDVITRSFNPKTPEQRLVEWAQKMNELFPERITADGQRTIGIVIKKWWEFYWKSPARSVPKEHSTDHGSSSHGA